MDISKFHKEAVRKIRGQEIDNDLVVPAEEEQLLRTIGELLFEELPD